MLSTFTKTLSVVAGCQVVAVAARSQGRVLLLAQVGGQRAAGVEAAAGGWVHRAGDVALQRRLLRARLGSALGTAASNASV